MQSLDEKTWDAVQVDSFADVMSGKDIYASERVDGERPYVTAGTANNGIGYFVGNDNNSVDSHVISVNRNGAVGEAFFHPYNALFGNDCRRLKVRESVADDTQQFIAVAIKEQKDAFSYSRKLGTGRLQRLCVMLPVTDSDEPDYSYMAEYIQQKRDTMLAKYRAYVEERIAELGEVAEIPALDEKEWKPIAIGLQFNLCRGRESKSTIVEGGKLPFVSAKKTDNGYRMFVEPTKTKIDGNTISLNNNGDGGAGFGYYQPYQYTVDVNTTALIPLPHVPMNPLIGLFWVSCFSWMHAYFGNARTLSNKRAEVTKIMLPVTDSGEPDYEYMEQYVKNMMLRKYRQYLSFIRKAFNEQP